MNAFECVYATKNPVFLKPFQFKTYEYQITIIITIITKYVNTERSYNFQQIQSD